MDFLKLRFYIPLIKIANKYVESRLLYGMCSRVRGESVVKKWNSVLANLAISHVSIIFVVVMLLMMENTVQTMEATVLNRVKQIYLDISLDKSVDLRLFAESSYASHLSEVIDLQELGRERNY